jgi:arylsulfatase A-like enzyme
LRTLILFIFIVSSSFIAQENTINFKKKLPNILWIVTEDISPTLSFYGDKTAKTPNLDKLATESLIYDNAYTTVGVCAPSRSSIITGMYPTSIGTMHMRTSHDVFSWGRRDYSAKVAIKDIDGNSIRKYAAVIPEKVKCYTEYLREEGYFTTNNYKTDYQFAAPVTAWDQNNQKAHWRNAPKGKPFFSIFNIDVSHESFLWRNKDLPLTVNPKNVIVPPYLPDNNITRKTIARHYSNVELMDKKVGKIIKELKEDGLYNNTIIFFYSDHGGPLPRQKREILDSGLKVPFIVKNLEGKTGRTSRLISFVDLAPTMLSLAGLKAKDYMEGQAFMGKYEAQERNYVFGSSDRFDEFSDRIRSVRNNRFLYLKNYHQNLPKYKDVGYRKNIAMMPTFLDLRDTNKLNTEQQIWFQNKTSEELYDCKNDPHNLVNLAEKEEYQLILKRMRIALIDFQKERKDFGAIPESRLIEDMWPNFEQPTTENVIFKIKNNQVTLKSKTKGASIGYIVADKPNLKLDLNSGWSIYHQPIIIEKGKYLYTIAERIGYKASEITSNTLRYKKHIK